MHGFDVRHLLLALTGLLFVGCGQNSDLDLDDIILAPDLELLDWDFEPVLASGQGSDLVVEMRNKGAIDARKFRVEASLIKTAWVLFNNENNVYDYQSQGGDSAFSWNERTDVQFLPSLQTLTVKLPVQPTTGGEALLEVTLDSKEELADPNREDNSNTEPCRGNGCWDLGKPFGDLVQITNSGGGIRSAPQANN